VPQVIWPRALRAVRPAGPIERPSPPVVPKTVVYVLQSIVARAIEPVEPIFERAIELLDPLFAVFDNGIQQVPDALLAVGRFLRTGRPLERHQHAPRPTDRPPP
jgi:hypothetical protein